MASGCSVCQTPPEPATSSRSSVGEDSSRQRHDNGAFERFSDDLTQALSLVESQARIPREIADKTEEDTDDDRFGSNELAPSLTRHHCESSPGEGCLDHGLAAAGAVATETSAWRGGNDFLLPGLMNRFCELFRKPGPKVASGGGRSEVHTRQAHTSAGSESCRSPAACKRWSSSHQRDVERDEGSPPPSPVQELTLESKRNQSLTKNVDEGDVHGHQEDGVGKVTSSSPRQQVSDRAERSTQAPCQTDQESPRDCSIEKRRLATALFATITKRHWKGTSSDWSDASRVSGHQAWPDTDCTAQERRGSNAKKHKKARKRRKSVEAKTLVDSKGRQAQIGVKREQLEEDAKNDRFVAQRRMLVEPAPRRRHTVTVLTSLPADGFTRKQTALSKDQNQGYYPAHKVKREPSGEGEHDKISPFGVSLSDGDIAGRCSRDSRSFSFSRQQQDSPSTRAIEPHHALNADTHHCHCGYVDEQASQANDPAEKVVRPSNRLHYPSLFEGRSADRSSTGAWSEQYHFNRCSRESRSYTTSRRQQDSQSDASREPCSTPSTCGVHHHQHEVRHSRQECTCHLCTIWEDKVLGAAQHTRPGPVMVLNGANVSSNDRPPNGVKASSGGLASHRVLPPNGVTVPLSGVLPFNTPGYSRYDLQATVNIRTLCSSSSVDWSNQPGAWSNPSHVPVSEVDASQHTYGLHADGCCLRSRLQGGASAVCPSVSHDTVTAETGSHSSAIADVHTMVSRLSIEEVSSVKCHYLVLLETYFFHGGRATCCLFGKSFFCRNHAS